MPRGRPRKNAAGATTIEAVTRVFPLKCEKNSERESAGVSTPPPTSGEPKVATCARRSAIPQGPDRTAVAS